MQICTVSEKSAVNQEDVEVLAGKCNCHAHKQKVWHIAKPK